MFLVFTVLNEVAKVMFLHVSVILSTGGYLVGRGVFVVPGGVSALGGSAWTNGGAWSGGCLVPGGVCSWGGTLSPGGSAPGGGIPACTEADPPPGETATAVDGTHPTGMHSC